MDLQKADELPVGVKPVVTGAINGQTDWTEALRGADGVVHLAAIVHKKEKKNNETRQLYKRTNTDAAVALATQALSVGVKSFVFKYSKESMA